MLAIIVVTYNRRNLLERCLNAIKRQSHKEHCIYIVDNASTDGTSQWLNEWLPENLPRSTVIELKENLGGAGGFHTGLETAIHRGAEWVWMMDDDAEPYPDSLERLLATSLNPSNVYGSLAVAGEKTSWITTVIDGDNRDISDASLVPACAQVRWIPFLGFMIHRNLVAKIGLPDTGFFIAADDVEYCLRAEKAGAKFYIAGLSRIEHPKSIHYKFRLPLRSLYCLHLAPWKRYYDTRNRILIARKHHGLRLFTQTIPGSFARLFAALLHEPRRLVQLWAFTAGLIDGLLGRKGRRHHKWGITQ